MNKEKSDWSKLSSSTKTILERLDINRRDTTLTIGQHLDIEYFNGVITKEIVNEIMNNQYSKENENYYSAKIVGNTLYFHFIKSPFEGCLGMF